MFLNIDFDFWSLGLLENHFYIFKPSGLWSFLMTI